MIHGPNLDLLGTREPEIYGTVTLADINRRLKRLAAELGLVLDTFQSNCEGELVSEIHRASGRAGVIIINAAAYTHTSVAIRDALVASALPVIEVHLSNVFAREEFRQFSYLSDIAVGVISGFGAEGYELALRAAASVLRRKRKEA